MKPTDLDTAYTKICQTMTDLGKEKTELYLARFALLAMVQIDDLGIVQKLITDASEGLGAEATE